MDFLQNKKDDQELSKSLLKDHKDPQSQAINHEVRIKVFG